MARQAFLVDDSKSARIVLSRLLKKSGFDQVDMAESGEEALEQLKNITPDAIFVDFLMDGMDGLETINEIKKDPRFVTTPVVMCTANEGDEYVRAAVDHGALGILAKPPTDQSLGEIIDLIEQHQREVASAEKAKPAAAAAAPVAPATAPAPAPAPVASAPAVSPGLGEAEVRRIAADVAAERIGQSAARRAQQVVEEMVGGLVAKQVDVAVNSYLEKHLESLVERLVERRLATIKPQEIDTEALRNQVVQQVNAELSEFVRQLNQRTVEGLIEASIHEQITEVANDFSQRLSDAERRIIEQVPEKNEMIEHVRVITEGSLESQVRETATQVAQEISNSVATETVENLLEQQWESHALEQQSSSGVLGWAMALLALAAAGGAGAYFLFLN
ncbi:MAG: response regulator [Candidatus Thiodiazotropha sp.]